MFEIWVKMCEREREREGGVNKMSQFTIVIFYEYNFVLVYLKPETFC